MPGLSTARCECYDPHYLAYHFLFAPGFKDALRARVLKINGIAEEIYDGCSTLPRVSSSRHLRFHGPCLFKCDSTCPTNTARKKELKTRSSNRNNSLPIKKRLANSIYHLRSCKTSRTASCIYIDLEDNVSFR